jgi:hypothetical protein
MELTLDAISHAGRALVGITALYELVRRVRRGDARARARIVSRWHESLSLSCPAPRPLQRRGGHSLLTASNIGGLLNLVNYDFAVTDRIDPADLIDASEVAVMLGLASRNAVSVYRSRYADFPAPRVEKGQNVVLWLRQDVEAWAKGRGRS